MKIPGEIFKKHIQTGEPNIKGYYLCYIHPHSQAINNIPMAEIKVIYFTGDKWGQGGQVIGWMGPLPVYSLDEIQGELGTESVNEVYAIGTLKEGKKGQFKDGPFYDSIKISLSFGEPGDYAFILNSRKSEPTPFKRWSESLTKWVELKSQMKRGVSAQAKREKGKEDRKKAQEKASLPYYIGTKKEAAFKSYTAGPFYTITDAMSCQPGNFPETAIWSKGSIIWLIFEGNNPFPERIWDGSKWNIIDIVQIRKIEKTVKILRKKYEKGN